MARIHKPKRMPLILPKESEIGWIDPKMKNVSNIDLFLKIYPDKTMDTCTIKKFKPHDTYNPDISVKYTYPMLDQQMLF
ncbi:hypothetical protein AB3N59_19630 [Leptospira sp. WS92.C1]